METHLWQSQCAQPRQQRWGTMSRTGAIMFCVVRLTFVDSKQTMPLPGQDRLSFGVCPGSGIGSDG